MPSTSGFGDHLKKDEWIPLHSFNGHARTHKRSRFIGLKPSILKLKILIEKNPDLYRGFVDMYKEAGPTSLVGISTMSLYYYYIDGVLGQRLQSDDRLDRRRHQ